MNHCLGTAYIPPSSQSDPLTARVLEVESVILKDGSLMAKSPVVKFRRRHKSQRQEVEINTK